VLVARQHECAEQVVDRGAGSCSLWPIALRRTWRVNGSYDVVRANEARLRSPGTFTRAAQPGGLSAPPLDPGLGSRFHAVVASTRTDWLT
jgi:hypothetical protein